MADRAYAGEKMGRHGAAQIQDDPVVLISGVLPEWLLLNL